MDLSFVRRNGLPGVVRMGVLVGLVLECTPLKAIDFIRGDVNSDGVVSIADAHFLNKFFFNGGAPPPCEDAADADDNGEVNVADGVFSIMEHLILGSMPPAAPYPEAGEDPTDDGLDCAEYGGGPAPVDSSADSLMILSATADSSTAGVAVVTIGISNSDTVGGYAGRIRAPAEVFADASSSETSTPRIAIQTLISMPSGEGVSVLRARVARGVLSFGYLSSVAGYHGIEPGKSRPALQLRLPLNPAVSSGDHSLEFESGEIVPLDPAFPSIVPGLVGGTLVVLTEPRFLRGDCNDDDVVDISDASCILNWLFLGRADPGCIAATDTNRDHGSDIADASYLLAHLFLGGMPPAPPYPDCGTPDPGTGDDELGCERPPLRCQ